MLRRVNSCAQTRRVRREEGAAAVEFALILPLLLVVVFGIISFGIIFAQELSLGNGARQGARYGVVAERSCAEIAAEARSGSATISMGANKVDVVVRRGATESAAESNELCDVPAGSGGSTAVVPCDGASVGENLYVYAKFDSEVTVPLVPMSGSVALEGSGVFRCEFS